MDPGEFLQSLTGTIIASDISALYSLNITITVFFLFCFFFSPDKLRQSKHKS